MNEALQLKITLQDLKPEVWRRVLVSEENTFCQLHEIIQLVFDWQNRYLYEFDVRGQAIGDFPQRFVPQQPQNARRLKLKDFALQPEERFQYVYDLGDWWRHEILVEAARQEAGSAVCLGGERKSPPEHIGGFWGYGEFLGMLEHLPALQYIHLAAWAGVKFEPEEFELEKINRALKARRDY
mgnify:CR=1 FL=1